MSEGNWNHPMFEEMRNAKVEAPEHIMHAAINKSNRRGFFYFQWHTLNVWYLALGLGTVLSVLSWNNKPETAASIVNHNGISSATTIKKTDEQDVKNNYSVVKNEEGVTGVSKRNAVANSKKIEHNETQSESVLTSTEMVQMVESKPLITEKEVVIDQDSRALTDLKSEAKPIEEVTSTSKQSLPKKGRPLKVKIGGNANP